MTEDGWRIDVTDDDVAAAKRAWMRAREEGAPSERIALLYADLEMLWRAQAKQLVESFQRGETGAFTRRAEPDPTGKGPGSGPGSSH